MIFKHIKLSGAILLSHALVMIVRDAMLANDENDNHVVSSLFDFNSLYFAFYFIFVQLFIVAVVDQHFNFIGMRKMFVQMIMTMICEILRRFFVLRCLVDVCSLKSTYFKIHTHSHTISCENDCFFSHEYIE